MTVNKKDALKMEGEENQKSIIYIYNCEYQVTERTTLYPYTTKLLPNSEFGTRWKLELRICPPKCLRECLLEKPLCMGLVCTSRSMLFSPSSLSVKSRAENREAALLLLFSGEREKQQRSLFAHSMYLIAAVLPSKVYW